MRSRFQARRGNLQLKSLLPGFLAACFLLTSCAPQGWQSLIFRTQASQPSAPLTGGAASSTQTSATPSLPFVIEWLLTAVPTATPNPETAPTLPPASTPAPSPSPNPNTTLQPTSSAPLCGGPSSLLVLVLGIDENAQSDSIRLVRVDFARPEVVILPIPRDFWVKVVDMSAYGITEGRINATFGYGEYFNGPGGGLVSITRNLEANFGIRPERYLALYFAEIADYIDLVGGVDLTLAQPVADGKLYFAAGSHHMDGQTAVSFMRMRYYDDDFHRIRRQSQVLTAFYQKVLSDLKPAELFKLVTRVLSDGGKTLNFSLKEIYSLICLARQLDGDSIRFVEIPPAMFSHATTNRGASVLIPSTEVPGFIQSVLSGGDTQ